MFCPTVAGVTSSVVRRDGHAPEVEVVAVLTNGEAYRLVHSRSQGKNEWVALPPIPSTKAHEDATGIRSTLSSRSGNVDALRSSLDSSPPHGTEHRSHQL